MKRLSNIGIDIPSNGENFIKLDSINSLSETDIAAFCPNFDFASYSTYGSEDYQGKSLYNKESSAKINEHVTHWNSEILHFIENGVHYS